MQSPQESIFSPELRTLARLFKCSAVQRHSTRETVDVQHRAWHVEAEQMSREVGGQEPQLCGRHCNQDNTPEESVKAYY